MFISTFYIDVSCDCDVQVMGRYIANNNIRKLEINYTLILFAVELRTYMKLPIED